MICDHSHNHIKVSPKFSLPGADYEEELCLRLSQAPAVPSAGKHVAEVNDSFTSIRALGTAYI